jgi:hypothetical protein
MPEEHYAEGIERANAMVPLNTLGNPDPINGRIVIMSVGMSNTASEWCKASSVVTVGRRWAACATAARSTRSTR